MKQTDETMNIEYNNETAGKKFELFPNKLINSNDFVTWMCHVNVDDLFHCNQLIEFPRTYRYRDIYPQDYAMGKY
ncbi:hypothetical protein BLA29_014946, partial [Euroglyphus maynei]